MKTQTLKRILWASIVSIAALAVSSQTQAHSPDEYSMASTDTSQQGDVLTARIEQTVHRVLASTLNEEARPQSYSVAEDNKARSCRMMPLYGFCR